MAANAVEGKSKSEQILQAVCKFNGYKELLEYYETKGEPVDYSWLDAITMEQLCANNGLDEADNRLLFNSTNVMEIVSLVLKGLKEKLK